VNESSSLVIALCFPYYYYSASPYLFSTFICVNNFLSQLSLVTEQTEGHKVLFFLQFATFFFWMIDLFSLVGLKEQFQVMRDD